jgi:hypothetical protein
MKNVGTDISPERTAGINQKYVKNTHMYDIKLKNKNTPSRLLFL